MLIRKEAGRFSFLMNRIRCMAACSIIMLFAIAAPMNVQAATLDEIENYEITIQPYSDGSLYMTYHIRWKVLDSTTEGPLTWVKIGIPNEYVEDITAISSSIDDISYYDNGGEYVRIDLDRKYYAGEVVTMDFAIHQHQMYQESEKIYKYVFTPGWFPDSRIDDLKIYWQAEAGVNTAMPLDGAYYLSHYTNVEKNGKRTVIVNYDKDKHTFMDDYAESANASKNKATAIYLITIFVGIPALLIVFLLVKGKKIGENDYYTKHSGMGTYYYRNHTVSTGRGSHGGGGCACACACACAGGGRAGCSVKEFYSAKKWKMHV